MSAGPSAEGDEMREQQMARLPHTYPLCRCGEDHHSEAFSAGWKARGEADAARADAQPRLVGLLDATDRVPAPFAGHEALVDAWHARGKAIRALAAATEPSAGAVERCAECENWEAAYSAAITSGIAGQGSKPPHEHSRPPVRCDGFHEFQPITCSRCGAHGTLNLSIVGEDERLDITKRVPAVERVDEHRVAQRTEADCIRAALSSITGLNVPDFTTPFLDEKDIRPFGDSQTWLRSRGWLLLDDTGERPMPGYSLAVGPSPTIPNANHATVALDGVVIWDPSPHRDDPGRVFTPSGYWPVRYVGERAQEVRTAQYPEPTTPPTRCAAHGQDHSDGCPADLGDGR